MSNIRDEYTNTEPPSSPISDILRKYEILDTSHVYHHEHDSKELEAALIALLEAAIDQAATADAYELQTNGVQTTAQINVGKFKAEIRHNLGIPKGPDVH